LMAHFSKIENVIDHSRKSPTAAYDHDEIAPILVRKIGSTHRLGETDYAI